MQFASPINTKLRSIVRNQLRGRWGLVCSPPDLERQSFSNYYPQSTDMSLLVGGIVNTLGSVASALATHVHENLENGTLSRVVNLIGMKNPMNLKALFFCYILTGIVGSFNLLGIIGVSGLHIILLDSYFFVRWWGKGQSLFM